MIRKILTYTQYNTWLISWQLYLKIIKFEKYTHSQFLDLYLKYYFKLDCVIYVSIFLMIRIGWVTSWCKLDQSNNALPSDETISFVLSGWFSTWSQPLFKFDTHIEIPNFPSLLLIQTLAGKKTLLPHPKMAKNKKVWANVDLLGKNGATFIKKIDKKQPSTTTKCSCNCCNCFNGNNNDSFDNEFDMLSGFVKSISFGLFKNNCKPQV